MAGTVKARSHKSQGCLGCLGMWTCGALFNDSHFQSCTSLVLIFSMNILIYICAAAFACSAWPPTTNSSYSHHSECNFNKNSHPFKSSTKTTKPRGSVLSHRFGYWPLWHNPFSPNQSLPLAMVRWVMSFWFLGSKHIKSKNTTSWCWLQYSCTVAHEWI